MSIKQDFFLVNQENTEKEEEDLRILNNISHRRRSNSKYQIQQYEKFKPKPKNEIEKIDSTILTAENKVKLLLSSFLNDLKAEHKKEEHTIGGINIPLKRKRTKNLKRKESAKKNSSTVLKAKNSVCLLKKINTICGNKYYKKENKKNSIQSQPLCAKRKNSINNKPLFLNPIQDNLPNEKIKYSKNLELSIDNNLTNSNIEKCVKTKRKRSIDIHFRRNEINLTSDGEKVQNKEQAYSTKKIKKYKINKPKFRNSNKKSIKPVINSSLYLEFDLNNIIDEKLLKLTGDIRKGDEINEILKDPTKKRSYNDIKNPNNICCSNFIDKDKKETVSIKKDFNISDIKKIEKVENINGSQPKNIISNENVNFNIGVRRTASHFSSKKAVNLMGKKNFTKMNTIKNLKEQIKNTIILRPEELNLTDESSINTNNVQRKVSSVDKEKLLKSKINTPSHIDNNNCENNSPNTNQNIDKRVNKKNLSNEDETINNKKNENSSYYSDDKNENQNQEKKPFSELEEVGTKKETTKENFRVLTCKKLVYDSLDDEEVEEENNNYIHPDSLFIKIFDNIVSLLAFSSLIYIPYYLASSEPFCKNYKNPGFIFNIFIEIVYFLDFIFGFFKAYYNFEEQLITNNISILKKYLESWFLLDLISTFPTYSYLKMKEPLCTKHFEVHPFDSVIHNLSNLIILNKLLKIFKYNFINQNIVWAFNKIHVNSPVLIQLLQLFSLLHFFSCLHILIGRNSYPNWIIATKLENAQFLDLYISSIYSLLASITTVGYGDIVCHSLTERIFQIILLIVGSIAYSWLLSSFSNYIQKRNGKFMDYENRKQILDEIKINHPKMSKFI